MSPGSCPRPEPAGRRGWNSGPQPPAGTGWWSVGGVPLLSSLDLACSENVPDCTHSTAVLSGTAHWPRAAVGHLRWLMRPRNKHKQPQAAGGHRAGPLVTARNPLSRDAGRDLPQHWRVCLHAPEGGGLPFPLPALPPTGFGVSVVLASREFFCGSQQGGRFPWNCLVEAPGRPARLLSGGGFKPGIPPLYLLWGCSDFLRPPEAWVAHLPGNLSGFPKACAVLTHRSPRGPSSAPLRAPSFCNRSLSPLAAQSSTRQGRLPSGCHTDHSPGQRHLPPPPRPLEPLPPAHRAAGHPEEEQDD